MESFKLVEIIDICDMHGAVKIVILGYMGSGKSLVGKELASKLQLPYYDLDSEIEASEGMTLLELFKKKGEIYFRNKEIKILKDLINSDEKMVLSLGGGTPCYGNTMQFLTSQDRVVTIYLKNSLEVLTERLHDQKKNRPLIAHFNSKSELNDFVRKHLFERSNYYNQAQYTVDATNATIPDQIEAIILNLF